MTFTLAVQTPSLRGSTARTRRVASSSPRTGCGASLRMGRSRAVTLLRVVEERSEEGGLPDRSGRPLDREAAERLARTLRTVADPTRLQVLSLLNDAPEGEIAVRDLVEPLGLRQPTISHHLRIMFEEGLLTRQQRGREVYYAIVESRRNEIADLLR